MPTLPASKEALLIDLNKEFRAIQFKVRIFMQEDAAIVVASIAIKVSIAVLVIPFLLKTNALPLLFASGQSHTIASECPWSPF